MVAPRGWILTLAPEAVCLYSLIVDVIFMDDGVCVYLNEKDELDWVVLFDGCE